jgi:tRNA G18 (ribose-2'-O)-methylase SpoU
VKKSREIVLILDNIRSAENVGSIFRTGDAIGVQKIFLTGVTPSPIDRFGRARKDISKSALGAEKSISWEYFEKTSDVVKKLKKEEFFIVAIEQDTKSLDYKKIKPKHKTCLIFGNEVSGINREILGMADKIAEIKMRGMKESLNVSVSAGVALYRLFD